MHSKDEIYSDCQSIGLFVLKNLVQVFVFVSIIILDFMAKPRLFYTFYRHFVGSQLLL